MSKMRQCPPGDEMQMKNIFSRRNFVCSGALVAAGCVASKEVFAVGAERALVDEGTAIRLVFRTRVADRSAQRAR